MPCRWSHRCRAAPADVDVTALPSPASAPDIDSWWKVRFGYIRNLRKQTRGALLLMAMVEILKHGPCEIVYAGRNGFAAPGADDYGLSYTVAYMLSYVYVCIFMIIFIPLFSWWIPSTPSDSGTERKLLAFLQKCNMIILPVSLAICGLSYLISFVQVFIYVDARPVNSLRLPKHTCKNWAVRALLLGSIVEVVALSYGALYILETMELARFKTVEYLAILLPIQMNVGLLIGSKIQMKLEKRAARKATAKMIKVEALDIKACDESAPLLDV